MKDFVQVVKRAALDAVYASKPVEVTVGTVAKASPLTIRVSDKMILTTAFLLIPQSLTDHTQNVTVDGVNKSVTVHSGLKVGEKVFLIRQQGGEKYVVAERVAGT